MNANASPEESAAPPALAVDLGGTKLLVGLVDATGRVLDRRRIPTPQGGPEAVGDAIRDLGAQLLGGALGAGAARERLAGVGVAVPGPTDHDRGVIYDPPNLEGWGRETPFGPLLTRILGGGGVHVENDANAAALGEAWVGAGRGARDLVYVTVSTGIGGGLILGGRLYRGANGTAGEIGHIIIDPEGPLCHCGNHGCLEALASGTAIAAEARRGLARGEETPLQRTAARAGALTAADVAEAARGGDAFAAGIYRRAGSRVGLVLSNLLTVLNPALIVVGGGVSKSGDLLFAPIRDVLAARRYPQPALGVRVVPAGLGDDVGIIGAAAVVYHSEREEF